MLMALTRGVSPAIVRCELTHLARTPIDVAVARAQHAAYEQCLSEMGCTVHRLSAGADMADSVFIEDTAVVFDEVAVVTRPGAPSRRCETPDVADALSPYRPIRAIQAPATLDGGDVLVVGRDVFVGRSTRTNDAAIDQMKEILEPYGYTVRDLSITGCLHLKSAVTALADDVLLANPAWVRSDELRRFRVIAVDPSELFGANALRVGRTIVYPAACPLTRGRIEQCGFDVVPVDLSETAKAEGGVTCCSLIFETK